VKVVLSTVGRFHMFALARELERRGTLERIYTGFNWSSVARERVARGKVSTFPWIRPILMAAGRFDIHLPPAVADAIHSISLTTLDMYVRSSLPDCDIFVGHEGVGLWSGEAAQRRGAAYVCDRGCTHIGWKEALLESEFDRVGLRWPGRPGSYGRELAEYDRADLIVVPSAFARDSFVKSGVRSEKVAVAAYGVDLSRFGPVERADRDHFDVLFVGVLSVRKGAHDLLAAFEALEVSNKRLTIVGPVRPEIMAALGARLAAPNIRLLGAVPQTQLKLVYGASDVMVLPSIEEGLALVQAEALACGCPVIATPNTGSSELMTDGVEGFIVPIRSPAAITERLGQLALDPARREAMSAAALSRVSLIDGWTQYGDRMMEIYLGTQA
jgi:glycosyltransferase involved in cell wall biosynthesis